MLKEKQTISHLELVGLNCCPVSLHIAYERLQEGGVEVSSTQLVKNHQIYLFDLIAPKVLKRYILNTQETSI